MNGIASEYLAILTDPAHSLVELTFIALEIILFDWARRTITSRWRLHLERRLTTEHRRLDEEHGVAHHPLHPSAGEGSDPQAVGLPPARYPSPRHPAEDPSAGAFGIGLGAR